MVSGTCAVVLVISDVYRPIVVSDISVVATVIAIALVVPIRR